MRKPAFLRRPALFSHLHVLVLAALALTGCAQRAEGTDGGALDVTTTDGPATDAPALDVAEDDVGESDGGATDAPDDVGSDDAGIDARPSGACPPGLGEFCEDDGTCPSPYECDIGRCRPQGRDVCGGFAAATCDTPPYTACLYNDMGADFGSCLTPEEVACICADPELSRDVVCP